MQEFYPDNDNLVTKIFKHLEKTIPLDRCHNREDIIKMLLADPRVASDIARGKKHSARVQNLINAGFVERIIGMKFIYEIQYDKGERAFSDFWKNIEDAS